jgi:glycosyltransferase involved in cell wall biosynthesis/GT2 family glycosyltransferase
MSAPDPAGAPARSLRERIKARLGRTPLDYTTGRAQPPDMPPSAAHVIVPVYGAHAEFARCLAALVAHTDLVRHGLLVVLDGPGQERAAELVREARLPAGAQVELLVNARRLGFVGSVNRAIAASTRDVVLLNSDAEVTAGWLDKLQAAAYADARVATVTPFCNDATLVSLPQPWSANLLPAGHDLAAFAALVERVSTRAYPRLPTGVGVCLYVKRRVLERVGALDPVFGLGYGEENDFCWRALAAGFVHVLDDATYVWHAGSRSFGRARAARVRRAERLLARRHPRYVPTLGAFLQADPLAPVRARVLDALRPVARPATRSRPTDTATVLHVVHGWPTLSPGGTEAYAAGLARAQAAQRPVAVFARMSDPTRAHGTCLELRDGAVRVRLLVNDFDARDPWQRNALRNAPVERAFAGWLDELRPALVHVHHLAGHSAGLLDVVAARGLPLVYQLQDWWPLCARSNLVRRDGSLCPGPGLRRCSACVDLTRLPPAGLTNLLLHRARRDRFRRALRQPDVFVAGSRFIVESYRQFGLLRAHDRVHVLPYGVDLAWKRPTTPREPTLPLRFGFLGALMAHKGAHVAVTAFGDIDPLQARLDVWGDAHADPAYASALRASAGPAVHLRGALPEADKPDVLAALDALIVPSIGLESFGIAAREALAMGVPVLASRLGALNELIDAGGVMGVRAGDADELAARLRACIAEPHLLRALAAAIPPVRDAAAHAHAIDDVYAELLDTWGRASNPS